VKLDQLQHSDIESDNSKIHLSAFMVAAKEKKSSERYIRI
jgi:hypothetical protein